jgi:hypothetical protein
MLFAAVVVFVVAGLVFQVYTMGVDRFRILR